MKQIKLDDIEKKSQPYSVPEGYFEDLPMKIQGRIQAEKKEPKTAWVHSPVFRLALSVAAVLVVVVSIVFVNQTATPEEMLADIPQEEILAYVNEMELADEEILGFFGDAVNDLDFFDEEGLDDLELEDEILEDVLIEYDLSSEYL